MKLLGVSWRTNLTGILGLLSALGAGASLLSHGNFNFNDPQWLAVVTGVTTAIGLINARDDKVSTEQVQDAASK